MKNIKKIMLLSAMSFGLLALTACGRLSDPDTVWNQTSEGETGGETAGGTGGEGNFTAGTFEGVGSGGYGGDITISVTIGDDGSITDIEVTDHSETESFAERAFEEIIPAMIETQSADVDVVSGATFTSNALIAALENALSQAGGAGAATGGGEGDFTAGTFEGVGSGGYGGDITISVTVGDDGSIADIEVTDHSETESFAERAFGEIIPAMIETQSADVDVVSGATFTSNALIAALENALSQAGGAGAATGGGEGDFTAGTFEGVGTGGYGGDITISLTVGDNGSITDVEVTDHSETESFAERAFEEIIPAVIESQSADVDVVSGATFTSNALLEAIANALEAAQ